MDAFEEQLELFAETRPARPVPSIPGLIHVPDFITPAEEAALLAAVEAGPWETYYQRRIQSYGVAYRPGERGGTPTERVRPRTEAAALPPWSRFLVARLLARGLLVEEPDQLGANEYLPGQGIAPHVDLPQFGARVAIVSLASPAEMHLIETGTGRREAVDLAPRSLLVLGDRARTHWRHGIPVRKSDHGRPRRRRISLTFRTSARGSRR